MSCGLLYVTPRPSDEEIDEGARIGLHKGGETAVASTGRWMPMKLRIYYKVLPDIYATGLQSRSRTWLDVGCGHGELLFALQQVSKGKVAAIGTEPDQNKVVAARKRGLDVSFFDLASHNLLYDVVSLLNVYSHLPSPPDFFRVIRSKLNPGGEILLETGDTAELPVEQHPRPFFLPDHLSFGSEKVISRVLENAGFQIVSVHKYPAVKLQFMKTYVLKNFIKGLLPQYNNRVSDVTSWLRVSRLRTDMWIRAQMAG
jgi:SAM-dependent methyltransferase